MRLSLCNSCSREVARYAAVGAVAWWRCDPRILQPEHEPVPLASSSSAAIGRLRLTGSPSDSTVVSLEQRKEVMGRSCASAFFTGLCA